jgi:hypothetical protein
VGIRGDIVLPFIAAGHFGIGVQVDATTPQGTPATAADKCAQLAAAISGKGVSAVASGATLSITSLGGDFLQDLAITSDTTKEVTIIRADLGSGQTVSVTLYPVPNLEVVPPAGTTFSQFFFKGSLGGTLSETANGTDTAATILNDLEGGFFQRFGFPFDETFVAGSLTGLRTPFFDPATVAFGWDGNTALYLANFGLEFPPPAQAPEPATLTLIGIGLAGIGFSRRRKQ